MTVVYTSVYGSFDVLRPQAEQDIDTEWVAFTDDPNLTAPTPWRVVVEAPRYEHPCMAAKYRKMVPPDISKDAVWIDGNMEVTAPTFAREALAARRDGMATFKHPRRDCIYTEAEASLGSEGQGGKYADLPIREQVAAYRTEGHPRHAGLFACGVIAWDLTAGPALGKAWLDECERWTYQDQLSLPVVARRLGVEPGVFPLSQIGRRRSGTSRWLENRWLRIHPHDGGGAGPLLVAGV